MSVTVIGKEYVFCMTCNSSKAGGCTIDCNPMGNKAGHIVLCRKCFKDMVEQSLVLLLGGE